MIAWWTRAERKTRTDRAAWRRAATDTTALTWTGATATATTAAATTWAWTTAWRRRNYTYIISIYLKYQWATLH